MQLVGSEGLARPLSGPGSRMLQHRYVDWPIGSYSPSRVEFTSLLSCRQCSAMSGALHYKVVEASISPTVSGDPWADAQLACFLGNLHLEALTAGMAMYKLVPVFNGSC